MDSKFQDFVEQLETKFQKLISMDSVKVTSLSSQMPIAGVYVFYEAGNPLYVGRTNRMKQRLKYHSQESANDAPFAFRLARERTGYTKATYQEIGSRKDLLSKPEFREAFSEAKARIREMDIRFVEETEQIRQALLEIYVAVVLDTPYNDFKTH
jgi:predicted GIY-YIG superfamily endonuclease